MSKRHHLFRFSLLLGWMLLTGGVGMSVHHPVAHAAAFFPPGYSLTLTESISTLTYGDPLPAFQAQLTVPDGENPLMSPNHVFFTMSDSGSRAYDPDGSDGSGSSYTFNWNGAIIGAPFLPVGQHTVVANYFSGVLNQVLQSAPVTFTIQKYPLAISCFIDTAGIIYTAHTVIDFFITPQGGPQIDWSNATVSITFFGPQTYTESDLIVGDTGSGTARGTANTPPVGGTYSYQCSFSGTPKFTAAQSAISAPDLIVSLGDQIGGITIYSNPTTITAGQIATIKIVVSKGSGLPTPTGSVSLFLAPFTSTNGFTLSGGQVTAQVQFPSPLPGTTLGVSYSGDAVYAYSIAQFSLTNPPIPGGSNPPPNPTSPPTNAATATPGTGSTSTPAAGSTASPASSSTAAPSSTTIANGGTSSGSHPTDSTSNQGTLVFWIVLIGLLVLAAGGSGAFIVLRKRARTARASATTAFPFSEEAENP